MQDLKQLWFFQQEWNNMLYYNLRENCSALLAFHRHTSLKEEYILSYTVFNTPSMNHSFSMQFEISNPTLTTWSEVQLIQFWISYTGLIFLSQIFHLFQLNFEVH